MAETLAQKAARLGMKPVGTQVPTAKETLAQKAKRLGIKPAGANNYQVDSAIASVPIIKQLSSAGVGIGSALGKFAVGAAQAPLSVARGIGKVVGADTSGATKMIEGLEKVKQNIYQKPFEKQLKTTSGKIGNFVGSVIPYVAPSAAITRSQAGITGLVSKIPAAGNLAKFGRGALGVVGRAIPEAIGAGAVGFLGSGGDLNRAKRDAAYGGAFSAGFGTIGAVGRGLRDSGLTQGILSKTTGISNPTFDAVKKSGIIDDATPERALQKSRDAVIGLRTKNTKMWQDALPKIADEYKGSRMSLTDVQIKNLAKVADEFSLSEELMPQNLKNMSVIESMNLMKALNELKGPSVLISPKGVIVRSLKKQLKPEIIKSFGGDKGKVAELWKNYGVKQNILDNMDAIVKAYKTNPAQTVTAKNRLMAIFDENKPEFLKAVKEIEEEMGVNLTSEIASTKFQPLLPKGILKADGGLPTKASIIDKLVKTLFLPLTSPKIAGKLAAPSKGASGPIAKRLLGDYDNLPQKTGVVIPKKKVGSGTKYKSLDSFIEDWSLRDPSQKRIKLTSDVIRQIDNDAAAYKPDKAITLYRGVSKGQKTPNAKEVTSWTYDREVAEMFAEESGGKVIKQKFQPTDVLVDTTMMPPGKFVAEEMEVLIKPRAVAKLAVPPPQIKPNKITLKELVDRKIKFQDLNELDEVVDYTEELEYLINKRGLGNRSITEIIGDDAVPDADKGVLHYIKKNFKDELAELSVEGELDALIPSLRNTGMYKRGNATNFAGAAKKLGLDKQGITDDTVQWVEDWINGYDSSVGGSVPQKVIDQLQKFKPQTESVVLYRGTSKDAAQSPFLSWTHDKKVAERFAKRNGGEVITEVVPTKDIVIDFKEVPANLLDKKTRLQEAEVILRAKQSLPKNK
jgi:hypothetical protein